MNMPEIADQKFWPRVDRRDIDGCWLWLAGKNTAGYGVLYIPRDKSRYAKPMLAHRFSLSLKRRRWVPDERLVLHSCDNPACVNPSHLRLGSHSDNTADAIARGRHKDPPIIAGDCHWTKRHPERVLRGSRAANATLTETQILDMLWRKVAGATYSEIASEFGVSIRYVKEVLAGKRWLHVHALPAAPSEKALKTAQNDKPGAKITMESARQIKQALAKGETGRSIARRFGLHFATVSDIKRGLIWRDA